MVNNHSILTKIDNKKLNKELAKISLNHMSKIKIML